MSPIELILPRAADLGEGMIVRRALPTRQRRMVGAWCFLDHAGPVDFAPGGGMHVGAHPHTCLQTFTWLIDGEVLHRDSLGHEQWIRPGQVNLMTAGHGIVHTEDSASDARRLHAAQLWIALPPELADCPPAFEHYPNLPRWNDAGCTLTLLAGRFGGRESPARIHTPLVGMDLLASQDAQLALPLDPSFEYGLLPLEGSMDIAGQHFATDEFAYLPPGRERITLDLTAGSRILLVGGEPFGEPVTMWWNFVGHDKAAIAQAQRDWESGDARFGPVKEGEDRRLVAPPLPWTV
ncbi:putative quercetin 2,3-dioxygenase [Zoogloea oryzae]|uniref:Quercetin 2,3-dioxygenase n=1 Tax=Zoogloea oryzae TaxID=310767 RepID=A0ABQ6FC12_9RHOO|nr:pirin family protein [Zoogloea oryzae]GLT22055.1 putative quercetin 2,3-dioxygenase [Zoogloea oryzae]